MFLISFKIQLCLLLFTSNWEFSQQLVSCVQRFSKCSGSHPGLWTGRPKILPAWTWTRLWRKCSNMENAYLNCPLSTKLKFKSGGQGNTIDKIKMVAVQVYRSHQQPKKTSCVARAPPNNVFRIFRQFVELMTGKRTDGYRCQLFKKLNTNWKLKSANHNNSIAWICSKTLQETSHCICE